MKGDGKTVYVHEDNRENHYPDRCFVKGSSLHQQVCDRLCRRYSSHHQHTLADYFQAPQRFQMVEAALIDFAFSHRTALSDYFSHPSHVDACVAYCQHATKAFT